MGVEKKCDALTFGSCIFRSSVKPPFCDHGGSRAISSLIFIGAYLVGIIELKSFSWFFCLQSYVEFGLRDWEWLDTLVFEEIMSQSQ